MTVVIQINAFFIITVKIQKTKMASDAKCALSQWKVKPIPLIFQFCPYFFHVIVKNKSMAVFYGLYSYRP